MTTRLEVIQRAGTKALGGQASAGEHRLVAAIAAMLNVAIASPRDKRKPDKPELPYGPGDVFKALEDHCSDIVQLRPYNTNTFGQLGRQMGQIAGLEKADLERVTSWIQSGGLNSWPTKCTWNHVVKHYSTWVAYARALEEGGGQLTQGAGSGSESWR